MSEIPPFGDKSAARAALFTSSERNRLIALCALLVVVVVAFGVTFVQKGEHAQRALGNLPDEQPGFVEQVALPPFDIGLVRGKIRDLDPADRILIETGPSEALFDYVAPFVSAHFAALGREDLTPEVRAAMYADPEAFRARALRVRGEIEELHSRTRPDGRVEHTGWIRTEDGEVVHFLVHDVQEGYKHVRLDGLFYKLFNEEGASGWEEGPLLVGARIVRSHEPLGDWSVGDLSYRLAAITDDTANEISGLGVPPVYEAQWMLLERAGQDALGIDWAAAKELDQATKELIGREGNADYRDQAFILDNAAMVEVLKHGDKYRGQPFQIPISRNQAIYSLDPGENPLRLDAITEGWIGNMTWTNSAGVIKFVMPGDRSELRQAERVMGGGFFLKNFAYEPKNGGLRVAPYFVVAELEQHIGVYDPTIDYVLYGVLVLTLGLVVLFPVLLLRDKRRSAALQRELVRRRQERRRRAPAGTH